MATKPKTQQSFLKSGTPSKSAPKPPVSATVPAPSTIQMMPLSLRFTQQQLDQLSLLRQKTGLRQNEIIRRAIDEYLKKELA